MASTPASHEEAWEQHFKALRKFRTRSGHCNVPVKHALGFWVSKQRNRHPASGGLPPLSGSRVARLEGLGFVWSAYEARWEEHFRDLVEYQQREGDCHVPQSYADNRPLGRWVQTQRTHHKNGRLSTERRERLEGLGFAWVRSAGPTVAPGGGRGAKRQSSALGTQAGQKKTTARRAARSAEAEAHATGAAGTKRSAHSSESRPATCVPGSSARLTRATKRDLTNDRSEKDGGSDEEMEGMKQQLAEAMARISELEREVTHQDGTISDLDMALADAKTQISGLEREVSDLQNNVQDRTHRGEGMDIDQGFTPFVVTDWQRRM